MRDGRLAELMEIRSQMLKFAGTTYEVDVYWHPEHGTKCVCFTKQGKGRKFYSSWEITDEGYDAKGIAKRLKNHITAQEKDAKARDQQLQS